MLSLVLGLLLTQQPADKKPDAEMNHRGEQGMGFSQEANTHHFLLRPDGGSIEVQSNQSDPDAQASIRMHMQHIAHAFQSGDFDIPMFVHDTVPPGVPEMKRLRGKITYTYEETKSGGHVVIKTQDKEAVAAIHKFLIFQIQEHKTGDPTGEK
jgi:hypothetical protein